MPNTDRQEVARLKAKVNRILRSKREAVAELEDQIASTPPVVAFVEIESPGLDAAKADNKRLRAKVNRVLRSKREAVAGFEDSTQDLRDDNKRLRAKVNRVLRSKREAVAALEGTVVELQYQVDAEHSEVKRLKKRVNTLIRKYRL